MKKAGNFKRIASKPRSCLIYGLSLAFLLNACGGGSTESPPSSISTHIETITVTPSFPHLISRSVSIYLPSDYASNTAAHPVLYLQDGEGAFSANNGWQADQAVEASIAANGPVSAIIVGIHNTSNRNSEYVPWDWNDTIDNVKRPGYGDEYVRWIRDELKPYVDQHYRTLADRNNTAIGGSSLGGLISMYAGMRYPDTFGKVMAMSPSFWVNNLEILNTVQNSTRIDTRVYMDSGTNEYNFANEIQAVNQRMASRGMNSVLVIQDSLAGSGDSAHTNANWRRRFPAAYAWLFASTP